MKRALHGLLLFALAAGSGASAQAPPLAVAVAANFQPTLRLLAAEFEARTGVPVRDSAASSGILYAQVRNGAAYDLLLSADSERPLLLERSGHGIAGSRFTYAIGRLTLWIPGEPATARRGMAALAGRTHRIAMANPRTAPYGVAARQLLDGDPAVARLAYQAILGNNVNQAFHFAISGNVTAALIAYSQIVEWQRIHPGAIDAGETWIVPTDRYDPLLQQAIMLSRETPHEAAVRFLEYLKSDEARAIIQQQGYRLPPR